MASAFVSNAGPMYALSSLWSSYKLARYREKGKSVANLPKPAVRVRTLPSRLAAACLHAAACGARFTAFVAVLKAAALPSVLRCFHMQGIPWHRAWLCACALVAHRALRLFDWSFALYLALRSGAAALSDTQRWFAFHPVSIFALHCVHNFLMTHRADWVSPYYVRTWSTVLSGRYADSRLWLADFKTDAAQSRYYREGQCARQRLRALPALLLATLRLQLPLVAAAVVVPALLFKGRSARQTPATFVLASVQKIVRSSLVLTGLPFMLTEFPMLYSLLTCSPPSATRRAPWLHTLFVSVLSTAAFLMEPSSRLRMIVVYTLWRVCEAAIMRLLPITLSHGILEHWTAAVFTAGNVLLCTLQE